MRVSAAMCARGRVVGDARLSPDGSLLAWVATSAGVAALVVAPAAGGPELVVSSDPVRSSRADGSGVFDWLADGSGFVVAGADGRLYRQDLAGGPAGLVAGAGPAAAPAVSPDGSRVAYCCDDASVLVAPIGGGAGGVPERHGRADFCADPAWAPDGSLYWHEWDVPAMAWDTSRIGFVEPGGGVGVIATPEGSSVGQPRPSPDGTRVGFLCDATGWLNLWVANRDGSAARVLVDEAFEHGAPTWGPGQGSWTWSPDGSRVAFCRNERGFGRLCLADASTGEVEELDRGWWWGLSWRAGRLAGVRSGARTPDQVVVWDLAAPEGPLRCARRAIARGPVAGFEAAGLVEPEPVTWLGEDVTGVGPTVFGHLYRAAVEVEEANPLVVWAHGGPAGQHTVRFDRRVCYFTNRGWNILRVDARGSTGYGRAYAQALRGRWGDLDVDDVAAGVRAAASRGWGDPGRVAVMGASSGALVALGVLARYPTLCAAGVDLYGVADLADLESRTRRFEAHYSAGLIGDLPEAAGLYRARSPIAWAGGIAVPVLVLHGGADPVVPRSQSDALVAAVAGAGGTVEYHVYEGEGHGWSRPEVVADELERIASFLARHVLSEETDA